MALLNIYSIISSVFFLFGIHFFSKKICSIFYLNKNLYFISSITLILFLSLISYTLNIYDNENINFIHVIIFNFFVVLSFIYFFLKLKSNKFLFRLIGESNYNKIYFLLILNLLAACLIPVSDADSIRYHLGQFNNFDFDRSFNLHEKISFIGDSLNHIAFSNNNLNLTSVLNLACLLKLINLIKKKLNSNLRLSFISIILGIPIYLNLMISQKPYLWICFSLVYIIYLYYKNYYKQFSSKDNFLIFIFLFLSLISKPEFLFINSAILAVLIFFYFKNQKNYLIHIFISSFILIYFLIINFNVFGDPLKIFLFQGNIGEINFLNFLKNSDEKLLLLPVLKFFLNLSFPVEYYSNFTRSLGFAFIFSLFFINLKRENIPLIILIVILSIINLSNLRISIDENHARNYLLIFLILIMIISNNKVYLKNALVKYIFVSQLIITQLGLIYYNYEYYLNNNYNQMAYQFKNEKYISSLIKNKNDTIILTEIDGNLFKDYNFLNSDLYNFAPNLYFNKASKVLQNNESINNVIIILKKKQKRFQEHLFLTKKMPVYGRNPFNEKKETFYFYNIESLAFIKLIDEI